MVYNKFGEEVTTHTVLAFYRYESSKAIKILTLCGTSHWIPKSMISNLESIDITNLEDEQPFEIASFIIDNLGIVFEY